MHKEASSLDELFSVRRSSPHDNDVSIEDIGEVEEYRREGTVPLR